MTADSVPEVNTTTHQLAQAFADLRQYLSTPTRAMSGAENALTRIETAAAELDDTHTTQLLTHGCQRIREEIDAMRTTDEKRTSTDHPLSSDPRECHTSLETPCTSAELRCDHAVELLDGMQFELSALYHVTDTESREDTTGMETAY